MTRARSRAATGPATVAAYSLGGRTYPMTTVPQCLTCQSPVRLDIERQMLTGVPFTRIAAWVENQAQANGFSAISMKSLRRHFDRGHLPFEAEVVRQVLDRSARQRGEDLDAAVAPVVSGVDFAEVVLQKTVLRLASGEIEPTVTDGLAAAKIVEQFREYEEAASEEVYVQAFMHYHEAAKRIMSEAQWEQFTRELMGAPEMQVLTQAAAAEGEQAASFYAVEEDVEDAVVVEDEDDGD